MTDCRIEPARADHLPGICQAHRAAVLGLARGHYAPEQLAAWAETMKPEKIGRALTEADKTLLVAVDAILVAGFVLYGPGTVWAMYVRPEYAGQGLGRRFLALAETAARRAGLEALRLTASRNAAPFYAKRGFRPTGAAVFRLAGGPDLDCLAMEKALAREDDG